MVNVTLWRRRLVLVLVPLLLAGCALVDGLGGMPQPGLAVERAALARAEEAFFAGDYKQARELYGSVEGSGNAALGNQARYGLLCLDIVVARNTHELQRAVARLQRWQEPQPGAGGYRENPAMLAAAVGKQVGSLDCKPEIRYVTTKKEGELAKKYEAEIKELKDTIATLEHQISVLQAIDQEIQEKRNSL